MDNPSEEMLAMAKQVSRLVDKGMAAIRPETSDAMQAFTLTQSVLFGMMLHYLSCLLGADLISKDDFAKLTKDNLNAAKATRDAVARQLDKDEAAAARKPDLKIVH